MKAAGLGVAAISYDPEATLKRFADAYQIDYPLLSDRGSVVIRRFGILNTNMPEGNMFAGIPFPGDYVLAPDATVIDKHFLPNYETRPTASGILAMDFDTIGEKMSASVGAESVRAKISLSSDTAVSGQELGVVVDIAIAPGWHIYGQPLPQNYVATQVTFDSGLIAKQSLQFPRATPHHFKILGETLPVYEGTIRGKGTVLIASRLKPGDYKIGGTLRFQECNDEICNLPQNFHFEIPVKIDGMTPGAKK